MLRLLACVASRLPADAETLRRTLPVRVTDVNNRPFDPSESDYGVELRAFHVTL